jgi:hypothetical protein
LAIFTSTPPEASRRRAPQRATRASVPSIASIPRTTPRSTTTAWPTSTAPSVLPVLLRRRDASIGAGARGQRAEHLLGADDPEPLALDLAHDRGEQPVVAEGAHADARERLRRAPVGPQLGEARAPDGADQADLADACRAQPRECVRELAEPHPGMLDAREPGRVGLPLEGKDEDVPALRAGGVDDRGGQAPAAGQHAEPRLHFSILGSVTARISALRMNSMIEFTAALSG